MKETIIYYYNFENIEIVNQDKYMVQFNYMHNHYFFVPFERGNESLKWILRCKDELEQIGFNCHKIVLNRFGNVLCSFKNNNYILLHVDGDLKRKIDIFDMVTNSKKILVSSKNTVNSYKSWAQLWERKVDYLEEQIKAFGNPKNKIVYNFSYYIGLAENAISYYSKISHINNLNLTLSHRRVFFPNIWLNYGNPLTFCFDVPERDFAEYIKSTFFYNSVESGYENFNYLLKIEKMDRNSLELLLSRLLFPSYYFDVFENFILRNSDENDLITIVNKSNNYEHFLKYCFNTIKKRVEINNFPTWIL